MKENVKIVEALKLAGKMATLTRTIVGGRDITTGRQISPISLNELSEAIKNLRTCVDEYDQCIVEMTNDKKHN